MKVILSFFVFVSMTLFTGFRQVNIINNSDEGTTFTVINQVNGLVDYMYGDCQPLPAGQIMPSKNITVFVKSGTIQKMSFRGPFGATYCHCAVKMLTGDAKNSTSTITLSYSDFCDHQ